MGRLWHAAGHDLTFAARDAAEPRTLADELGERAHAATVTTAVAGAEVVLVAVPGTAVVDVLKAAGSLDPRVGAGPKPRFANAAAGTSLTARMNR